jgi:2,4-dienoyl-CoA reductase-like NADH-dependent reductase (Old Yellow Enzyme family)
MKLFEPMDVNQMRMANRIVLTAMVTRLSSEDGLVNQAITDRYVRFARGEPGLVIVEATAVHASKSGPLLRLNSDEFIPGHREMVQRIHDETPTKVALQIIHFLKISRRDWRQTVDMLSLDDIQDIIQAYGEAAVRTREAGYDAVELHMAHAYTLSSFLSKRNPRTDAYGGKSLESRLRMASEVISRVRETVGDDYPVGVRFVGEEAVRKGYGLNESKYIALRMAQLGVDYISLSAGGKFEDAIPKEGEPLYPYTGYSGERTMPPAQYQDGANVYLAEGIKSFINAHGYQTPVVAAGKISTPELAESTLQEGKADLIGMARALLADPDWPKKVRAGRPETIVRCMYVNVCKALDESFKEVKCTLWLKGFDHPPEGKLDDVDPPVWPEGGAGLKANLRENGTIRLDWQKAIDPEGMYGYEVFRGVNDGPLAHLESSQTNRYVDEHAVAGNTYHYQVLPYDFGGNRGENSEVISVEIPVDFEVPEGVDLTLDGDVEADRGYSA